MVLLHIRDDGGLYTEGWSRARHQTVVVTWQDDEDDYMRQVMVLWEQHGNNGYKCENVDCPFIGEGKRPMVQQLK